MNHREEFLTNYSVGRCETYPERKEHIALE